MSIYVVSMYGLIAFKLLIDFHIRYSIYSISWSIHFLTAIFRKQEFMQFYSSGLIFICRQSLDGEVKRLIPTIPIMLPLPHNIVPHSHLS